MTIILTTHYIEEAEEMADRVGVINQGRLILVEETAELMRKLGKKRLTLQLHEPLERLPAVLVRTTAGAGRTAASELVYTYDTQAERTGITALLRRPRRGRHRVPGPAAPSRARWRRSS